MQLDGPRDAANIQKLPVPILRLAFRPFFLLGALFSIVCLFLWIGVFSSEFYFQPYGGAYWWHIHEMLFGFTTAIIVGFLLTAVQTWTGIPGIRGWPLLGLVLLWLSARLALAFPQEITPVLGITLDLLFVPIAAICLAYPIIKVKMWRNLIFIPILLLMSFSNATMHCSVALNSLYHQTLGSHSMVLQVTLVMCILGGRVFPMFTANGTQTPRVAAKPWLEVLSIGSVLLVTVFGTGWFDLPTQLIGILFLIAGVANFVRALRWRIWVTFKTPLLWTLHLSYWSIAIGLGMMGLAKLGVMTHTSPAVHALAIGGIGIMILSMIARVSLGHTGRSIQVGPMMTFAFVFIALAFLTRVFAPLLFDQYLGLIQLTGLLWGLAYTLFILVYLPILTSARIDGKPG